MRSIRNTRPRARLKPPDVQISVQNFGLIQKVDRAQTGKPNAFNTALFFSCNLLQI